jgi:carbon storage regulator
MLVLSRNVGEILCIGEDVQVKIIDIRGDRVRIGIEAPREMSVVRSELLRRDEREAEQ